MKDRIENTVRQAFSYFIISKQSTYNHGTERKWESVIMLRAVYSVNIWTSDKVYQGTDKHVLYLTE